MFERFLRWTMIGGVAVSTGSLSTGLAISLLRPGARVADTLLTFGLILLMATPMLRVALAVVESVRSKDWWFVATTAAVLLQLALTLFYASRQ